VAGRIQNEEIVGAQRFGHYLAGTADLDAGRIREAKAARVIELVFARFSKHRVHSARVVTSTRNVAETRPRASRHADREQDYHSDFSLGPCSNSPMVVVFPPIAIFASGS
jgi:hypothetical protein